ncbi:MAG: sulfite exporter TauE/SafE family protein [Victivallales bacterium]|nr:sulfite exporter TauE/SafE family protein [Victivallales bacterium]
MNLLVIVAACFTGGLVQGSAGFGIGLVSIAILSLFMPVREAAIANVLAALCVNLFMVFRLRSYFSLARIGPVVPAIIAGVPIGVFVLANAKPAILTCLLGGTLMVSGIQALLGDRMRLRVPWHPIYIGIPCGLFSGALSGAYGTGGPPIVAYVLSQRFERRHYAVAVQLLLAIAGTIRIIEIARNGMFHGQSAATLSAAALSAVAGSSIGILLLHRLSDQTFRRAIAWFLILVAAWYLWKAMM